MEEKEILKCAKLMASSLITTSSPSQQMAAAERGGSWKIASVCVGARIAPGTWHIIIWNS